jgi:hypothetical protein
LDKNIIVVFSQKTTLIKDNHAQGDWEIGQPSLLLEQLKRQDMHEQSYDYILMYRLQQSEK